MNRTDIFRVVPTRDDALLAAGRGPELPFQRGDHVELAGHMLARLHAEDRASVVGDEGELFRYSPATGLWAIVSHGEQSRIAQSFAGAAVVGRTEPLRVSAFDVRGAMTLAQDQVAQPGYFSAMPAGLAFANGFVSVSQTGTEIASHSPVHRARHGFDFDYVRDSPIPLFLRFLDDLFRRRRRQEREDRRAPGARWSLAAWYRHDLPEVRHLRRLWGRRKIRAGEDHLRVFPSGTVEAVPPQEFREEYWLAMLAGTLLNVVAELPAANTLASEAFNAIVAGDLTAGRTDSAGPVHIQTTRRSPPPREPSPQDGRPDAQFLATLSDHPVQPMLYG
jgi:hypothetical protein